MKKIVGKNWQLTTRALVTALVLILLHWSLAAGGEAGGGEDRRQLQRIDVQLVGVDSFVVIQLVDQLLGKIPGVVHKQQTGLRLLPEAPDNCKATWSLELSNGDEEYVSSELHEMMRDSSRQGTRSLLISSDLSYDDADIEALGEIVPVKSIPGYIWFGVKGRVNEYTVPAGAARTAGQGAWYTMPGAGFE